jgi:hypothetical protein
MWFLFHTLGCSSKPPSCNSNDVKSYVVGKLSAFHMMQQEAKYGSVMSDLKNVRIEKIRETYEKDSNSYICYAEVIYDSQVKDGELYKDLKGDIKYTVAITADRKEPYIEVYGNPFE